MDDLISRQAAIEALKDMYHAAEKWLAEASDDVIKARAESCMASLVEMKLRIEKLPSAQPERKRGKWIDGTATHIKTGEERAVRQCSQCGAGYFRYDISENTDLDIPNFCPNCGSDNRGEKDEAD